MGGNYSDGELAWTSFDMILKEYTKRSEQGDNRFHPTQKPVGLYNFILHHYAKEGYKILDTHFGSGSIALAVDKANRLDKMNLHLTACEIDKEYIGINRNSKYFTSDTTVDDGLILSVSNIVNGTKRYM